MAARIQNMASLATFIRQRRKFLKLSQVDLAGASGLGVRFIGDLERGKPTCEIGKVLHLLTMLGVEVQLNSRDGAND
jgi:HTH-type transcriptional regulator/antitoxin HipB